MIRKYKFQYFFIIGLCVSQLGALPAAIASDKGYTEIKDINHMRKHARYVLRKSDATDDTSIYLYAPNETDELCDFDIGYLCIDKNGRFINGDYSLVVTTGGNDENAAIISSTKIGGMSFGSTDLENKILDFFPLPSSTDNMIILTAPANADGKYHNSFFRLDKRNHIYPSKFFLKNGDEWQDIESPSVKENKLCLNISYNKAPPDIEYLRKLPGRFDQKTLIQTLCFIYKDSNFYESPEK